MNTREPLKTLFFSIITCTLNSEKYLAKNIQSVEKQALKNYEHIFVDGGSRDRTREIINAYKKKAGKEVKLVVDLEKGVSAAFNRGIKEAGGKYLIFLNSDDYFFDKDVLLDVYNYLKKNPDIDWIYGQIETVNESGKKIGRYPRFKIFQVASPWLLKAINFIPHQAVFISRQVFKKFGNFNINYKYCMDYDFWLRTAKFTCWIYIPMVISKYRIHEDSISSSSHNCIEATKEYRIIQGKNSNGFERRIIKLINYFVEIIRKNYLFKIWQLLPIMDEYLFKYRKSYSLEGEDVLIEYHMGHKSKGFYVDIGASHPIVFSNTYRFYKRGWRGINIDVTPGVTKIFNKVRPGDINLELGVADREENLTLYLFKKPTLNTMDKQLAEEYKKMDNKIIKTINVKTHTLCTILDKYLPKQTKIDLMNVDTEGFDLRVLKSNNWSKFRPSYIVVETTIKGARNVQQALKSDTTNFLSGKGYSLISKLNNSLIFKDIK
jgi:FkbM family methyltransferase